MNARSFIVTAALLPALALQSCVGNLADDAFAHAVKSGNARAAVANIQPGQATLLITERNGRTYYPIHYALCRGDAATTFDLIHNGSPTRLDGRSLAYNAARVGHYGLAQQLASAGYGSPAEISAAKSENQRQEHSSRQAVAAGTALGILALMALAGGAGGSNSGGQPDDGQDKSDSDYREMMIRQNKENFREGLPPADSSYPGYHGGL